MTASRRTRHMLEKAGACVTLHSDDQDLIQRLNQETAEAVSAGRRAGIDIPEREAIEWITRNPAKVLADPRPDRHARARQAGGRGDLEQGPVLDLRPDPAGLHRRGTGLRPPRSEVPNPSPTSCSASPGKEPADAPQPVEPGRQRRGPGLRRPHRRPRSRPRPSPSSAGTSTRSAPRARSTQARC